MPIVIFTDGASSGNPGPGGWGAILVDENHEVYELGGGDRQTTNNRMELTAALEALRFAGKHSLQERRIELYTDSTYVIRGITQWIRGWKRNAWKTAEGKDVINRDLWEELDNEARACPRLRWNYVPGHAGIAGNERVDEIAVAFAQGKAPDLFRGSLQKYPIQVLNIPAQSELERLLRERDRKSKPASGKTGTSYYLSLVRGTLARDATWAECQARVSGVSGARFKKVSSIEEEKETLRSWGVPQD